jgi:hypothetical protein
MYRKNHLEELRKPKRNLLCNGSVNTLPLRNNSPAHNMVRTAMQWRGLNVSLRQQIYRKHLVCEYCILHAQFFRILLWIFSFSLSLQPPWALASDFQFHDYFTDGRTPWTSVKLVARPLPKHRATQTHNKYIHIPNIHALYGIRTHDPGFRASEDSTCFDHSATVTGCIMNMLSVN